MKKLLVLGLSLCLIFTAVACGNESNNEPEATSKAPNATEAPKLEGDVIVDGSGTVFPLMAAIAEQYMTTVQKDVSVQVSRAGSSAGFKKFIAEETDFSDASRKIKDSEIEGLKEKGYEYGTDILEFKMALDGLTIVINKNNTWAQEMTKDEIINMYISGTYNSDDKVMWSDIRSSWPNEEVKFFGPNENHGTYEFFWEVILGKKDLVKTATLEQEYSTLVDLVSKEKNAIAFFGFGYYVSNTDKLTAVKVDFGNGPVEPTLATIGETLPYAGFTRPVFTYLNVKFALDKPQVLDYAKYVVSPEGALKLAGEKGFAPLPASEYAAYAKQLDDLN